MYLAVALVLLLGFAGNVLMGSLGNRPLLGNVGELLLLIGVSVFFVAAVLIAERDRARAAGVGFDARDGDGAGEAEGGGQGSGRTTKDEHDHAG